MPLWMMCTIMGIALVVIVVVIKAAAVFTGIFAVDDEYQKRQPGEQGDGNPWWNVVKADDGGKEVR